MVSRNAIVTSAAFLLGVFLIIGVMGLLYIQKVQGEKVVLYYGNTCPHCHTVRQFIADSNLTEKLGIVEKEVYNNTQNNLEMEARARSCNITGDLFVPFIYSEGACYMGGVECEAFLRSKMG